MIPYLNRLVGKTYHLQRITAATISDHPAVCALFHVNIWIIHSTYLSLTQFNSLTLQEVSPSILILNNANPQQ